MDLVYGLQRLADPTLDRVMLFVTNLGSEYAYVALLVVAFVAVDARRGRSLALAFLAGFYLNLALKELFATPRPFQVDPEVARSPEAIDTAPGNGFPSGHAQGSTTFWGLASAYVRRSWFSVLAAVVVLGVSVSRVYLGVHLPIDVVGGWAFGLAVIGIALLLHGRKLRLGTPAVLALGLALPLAVHLLWPSEESGLLLGALAAFAVGPQLVRHDTSGPVIGRVVLGAIGLALVFGALMGSSSLLPEELKRSAFGSFGRFFLIGCVGTVVVPLLGRATGLTPAGRSSGRQVGAVGGADA